MQDCEFFTFDEVKDGLFNILYLWGKDNVEFGYRQGMNEVLAILVSAFFSEIVQPAQSFENLDKNEIKKLSDD